MKERIRSHWLFYAMVIGSTFLSGTAALIYEVVWSRMLSVVVGNGADAIAIVLASFMLGMALGAGFLGGIADKVRFPLRFYAWFEIMVAGMAALMPILLPELNAVEALRGTFESHPTAAVGRIILVASIIVLPSMAMGATLPIVCRALATTGNELKRQLGVIYGANTLGAMVGASVAGFVIIPFFGLSTSSLIGASLSSLAAALLFLAAGQFERQVVRSGSELKGNSSPGLLSRNSLAALIALTVSGFVMIASEMLWSRFLTFIFGHDTYAFAVLLSAVLLGLGIGGLLFRILAERNVNLLTGLLLALSGLVLIDCYWLAATITVEYGRDPFGLGDLADLAYSLHLEFLREILFAPILVLLPAVLAGATVPAALAVLAGNADRSGTQVGLGLLANGVGSAAGALVAALGLVQLLGIQGAFILLGSLLGTAAIVVLILLGEFSLQRRSFYLAIPLLLMLVVVFAMPSGLPKSMLREAVGKGHQEIQFYEEGRIGTVSVTRNVVNDEKQLFMNSVNEVTTRLVHDQSFKFLGHLGPLLHPRPRAGLMICLGAGLSAGAALVHPFAKLDVVELSSSVYRAAELWGKENNGVLNDPRLHVHFGDGRHFLAQSAERYDVVMVDSTHPKSVDSWILYTREFYELVKSRLEKGGIAIQWVPLHGLSEREFKIILGTFLSVFPQMTLWSNVGFEVYGQAAYVKLVGMEGELQLDFKELALRLKEPRIARDLEPFGMADPVEILDSFQADAEAVKRWTAGLPIQTDNRPILPYITEHSTGRRMEASLLLGVESPVLAHLTGIDESDPTFPKRLLQAVEARGFLLAGLLSRAEEAYPESKKISLFKERFSRAEEYYRSLSEIYSRDGKKLFEIANYLGNLGYAKRARELYGKALEVGTFRVRAEINLALVEYDLGEERAARKRLSELLRAEPDNALINFNLGVILKETDRLEEAARYLGRAAELAPSLTAAQVALADAERKRGRLQEAEKILRRVVRENYWIAEAWDLLGLIAQSQSDWEGAKKMHVQALQLEPYRASAHYNLGIALQETGRLRDAREAYRAALRVEPDDPRTHNNLGLVEGGGGNYVAAVKAHQRALELDPEYAEAAYNEGLAWSALGERWRAVEAFETALKIAPHLEVAREQLEKVRPSLSGEPMDGAIHEVP